MSPVKDNPGRRTTDDAQGLNTDHHNQESGDSDISEGRTPDKARSGRVRHDAKGNSIWQWSGRFKRQRADDPPVDLECLGGEDLALAEDETSSKTESMSSDILEATARMKVLSFDKPSRTQRVLSWLRGTRSR